VGKPMTGVVHIVGEDGNELPPGQPGEIYFEGGYSFEYLNDPSKTAASRDNHGWVTVGDVGYVDDEGYLFLTDRRHHMIISGGVNIYPQETENLLVTHPPVLDAAVFGVPDDEMGQRVVAAVQTVDPADGTDQFAEELSSWLRERLSHFKCPRSIAFEAQLPRTDTGRLYKNGLIEKYSVELMLRVVALSNAPDAGVASPPGVVVAHGSAADIAAAGSWPDAATFTLTEDPCADRRVVTVESVSGTVAELTERNHRWPQAGAVCDDVLRALDPAGPTMAAVITESLAYLTLQAGPEFARWLQERG